MQGVLQWKRHANRKVFCNAGAPHRAAVTGGERSHAGRGQAEAHAAIRQLVCKVQEIHTTLLKHLAKEEEQLFPLLLKHFTYSEQA